MSLSDLDKVVKNVQSSVNKAGANMAASWSVMAEGFGRVNDMIQKLAASYANAELNATRLEVIMRQRMKSTDAEISSIKKLTSAQAELGIISAGGAACRGATVGHVPVSKIIARGAYSGDE